MSMKESSSSRTLSSLFLILSLSDFAWLPTRRTVREDEPAFLGWFHLHARFSIRFTKSLCFTGNNAPDASSECDNHSSTVEVSESLRQAEAVTTMITWLNNVMFTWLHSITPRHVTAGTGRVLMLLWQVTAWQHICYSLARKVTRMNSPFPAWWTFRTS